MALLRDFGKRASVSNGLERSRNSIYRKENNIRKKYFASKNTPL